MKLSELIERLETIREEVGDAEIRAAFQPSYPLVAEIDAISTMICDEDDATVYIAIGNGHEYGSREMWCDDYMEIEIDEDDE